MVVEEMGDMGDELLTQGFVDQSPEEQESF